MSAMYQIREYNNFIPLRNVIGRVRLKAEQDPNFKQKLIREKKYSMRNVE